MSDRLAVKDCDALDVDTLHTMAREWLAISTTLPDYDGPELVGPARVWKLAAHELARAIGRRL